jgi:hypothetical protein
MAGSAAFQELVVLFDATASRVERELHIDDFDGLLAGEWILEDRAADTVRAAYVQVGPALAVTGIVFFQLKLDGLGYADPAFNVPLEYMALQAGPGPDLGAGPVRMACRSQCPVPWHTINLWEPAGLGEAHTAMEIQQAVWRNRLALKVLPAVPLPAADVPARTRRPQEAVQELDGALRRTAQRQALEQQLRALDDLEQRQAVEQRQALQDLQSGHHMQGFHQTQTAEPRLAAGFAGTRRLGVAGPAPLSRDASAAASGPREPGRYRDAPVRPSPPGQRQTPPRGRGNVEQDLPDYSPDPLRAEMQRQQQGYLEQINACRDEIQKLKAALRYEQERNRRLQQLLRGDL